MPWWRILPTRASTRGTRIISMGIRHTLLINRCNITSRTSSISSITLHININTTAFTRGTRDIQFKRELGLYLMHGGGVYLLTLESSIRCRAMRDGES